MKNVFGRVWKIKITFKAIPRDKQMHMLDKSCYHSGYRELMSLYSRHSPILQATIAASAI